MFTQAAWRNFLELGERIIARHHQDWRERMNFHPLERWHDRLQPVGEKAGLCIRTVVEKIKNGELTAEDIVANLSKRKSRA
jgi:hypothetical protein